jgi:hypothetical protein
MLKSLGWLQCALVAGWVLTGCADDGTAKRENAEIGTIALPLTTYGSSGVQYQLRNASFQITPQYYYYGVGGSTFAAPTASAGTAVMAVGGMGVGSSTGPGPIVVSSETDPEAPSIEVDLENGSYQIYLLPGWTLERIENGVATAVEAQLLSGERQWAYVSPRSTSWVSYQFGVGDRGIWFNGKLNVEVQVYENPDEYYGPSYGGFGGMTAVGGAAPVAAGGSTTIAVGGAGGFTGI